MDETIDRFGYTIDLDDELGRGAFGTVYKGTDGPNGTVAMKKINKMSKRNTSAEAVRSHYMKDIDHVNIVKVYDVQNWKDSMWIIMEFCNTGDLNNFFIGNQEKVPTNEFRATVVPGLMRDIASGLAFLHDKDIVHRDIKPANILVKKNEQSQNTYTAKLSDFGFSKFLDPAGNTSAMSSDIGTLAFKAPEFWDRKPDEKIKYHRKIDVYATGLTFVAMLQAKPGKDLKPTGVCQLQPSETNMAIGFIAFTRREDIVLDLPQLNPNPRLSPLIKDMVRTDPAKRQNAETVLRRLQEAFTRNTDDSEPRVETERVEEHPEEIESEGTDEASEADRMRENTVEMPPLLQKILEAQQEGQLQLMELQVPNLGAQHEDRQGAGQPLTAIEFKQRWEQLTQHALQPEQEMQARHARQQQILQEKARREKAQNELLLLTQNRQEHLRQEGKQIGEQIGKHEGIKEERARQKTLQQNQVRQNQIQQEQARQHGKLEGIQLERVRQEKARKERAQQMAKDAKEAVLVSSVAGATVGIAVGVCAGPEVGIAAGTATANAIQYLTSSKKEQ